MKRVAWIGVLLFSVALPAAAVDRKSGHDATMAHSFEDAQRWAERFDAPERADWQKPFTVIRILGLEKGFHVADLGCGTGYFVPYLSALVGAEGKVYAVDIEQGMLDYVLARKDLPKHENVVPILAEPEDPKLPQGELDLILTVNTWHHINKRLKYLKRLAPALKPGGRLVLIDWREGDLPQGPPEGHKLSREAVIRELDKAGWNLTSESVALPYQYVLIFEAPQS